MLQIVGYELGNARVRVDLHNRVAKFGIQKQIVDKFSPKIVPSSRGSHDLKKLYLWGAVKQRLRTPVLGSSSSTQMTVPYDNFRPQYDVVTKQNRTVPNSINFYILSLLENSLCMASRY